MVNKDTMTTQRLRKVKNKAIWGTIITAIPFLRFFNSGDDVFLWLGLAFMPILISEWATVFQGGVEGAKLDMVAGVGALVILLVGWHLTNSWWLLGGAIFFAAYLVLSHYLGYR